MITVFTVDDHPLIRAGLRAVIGPEPDMAVVGEASNGEEAVTFYREHRPDVVLMDLRMPIMDGVQATEAIIAQFPDAKIVALTTYEGDEDIYRALSAGAKGYVIKDMLRTELLRVIRRVYQGQRGIPAPVALRLAEHTPRAELTPREVVVLRLMSQGLSNREIAAAIGREESTVKAHVKNLMMKLDVKDRTALVVVAIQRGFLHVE